MDALLSNDNQSSPFVSQENSALTRCTAAWATYSHILLWPTSIAFAGEGDGGDPQPSQPDDPKRASVRFYDDTGYLDVLVKYREVSSWGAPFGLGTQAD